MKTKLTILAILMSVFSVYSQKNVSDIEKASQSILKHATTTKGNIWVLDKTESFTGQGASGWLFDYEETTKTRNSKGLPTLIETSELIEGTANWRNRYHAELEHHNNDTVSEYRLKEWNISGGNWLTDLSYFETKDVEGKKLIHYTRSWQDANQIFNQGNKEIYTYDAGGVLTEMEDRDWDYMNSVWTNWAKTYFTYDANDNLTLKLYKRYQSGTYNDNWKTEYSYDGEGRLSVEQEWGYYSGWADYSRVTYTYYENDLIKEVFTERYYSKKSGWDDIAKTKYFYNTENLLEYKEELDLQNSGNNLKYVYTYNSDDQETTFFLYDWNGSEWVLFYKVFDAYDVNKNQTSFYSQTNDGTWKNYIKEEYSWNEFSVSLNSLPYLSADFYPNPASNYINIISEEDVNVKILNAIGQVVYKANSNTSNLKVDISEFPSGIYFLNTYNKKGTKVFKFLKK